VNAEIKVDEDDNFKIITKKFGEQYLASDGEQVAIAPTPEKAIKKLEEQSIPKPTEVDRGPKPAPIINKSYSGTGWFEGTPWSTNNR
jgi:hypothetical protein